MNLNSIMEAEKNLLLPTYDRQKVLFTRGKGVYLWDSKGKRYLDFLSGIGVNALGHAHPAVLKVIKHQAGKLIHTSNLFFHPYQSELARRLTRMSGMDRAFFCNSGTEAWEGALKLARAYARTNNSNGHKAKWRLLALENSFHEIIGKAVRLALDRQCELQDLKLTDLQQLDSHFGADFFEFVSLRNVLAIHDVSGGTAPARVKEAITGARQRLGAVQEEAHAHA